MFLSLSQINKLKKEVATSITIINKFGLMDRHISPWRGIEGLFFLLHLCPSSALHSEVLISHGRLGLLQQRRSLCPASDFQIGPLKSTLGIIAVKAQIFDPLYDMREREKIFGKSNKGA